MTQDQIRAVPFYGYPNTTSIIIKSIILGESNSANLRIIHKIPNPCTTDYQGSFKVMSFKVMTAGIESAVLFARKLWLLEYHWGLNSRRPWVSKSYKAEWTWTGDHSGDGNGCEQVGWLKRFSIDSKRARHAKSTNFLSSSCTVPSLLKLPLSSVISHYFASLFALQLNSPHLPPADVSVSIHLCSLPIPLMDLSNLSSAIHLVSYITTSQSKPGF